MLSVDFRQNSSEIMKERRDDVAEASYLGGESYTSTPECQDLQYLFDISGWLAEHIVPIKYQVYPHTFKFYLGEDKKEKCFTKTGPMTRRGSLRMDL